MTYEFSDFLTDAMCYYIAWLDNPDSLTKRFPHTHMRLLNKLVGNVVANGRSNGRSSNETNLSYVYMRSVLCELVAASVYYLADSITSY